MISFNSFYSVFIVFILIEIVSCQEKRHQFHKGIHLHGNVSLPAIESLPSLKQESNRILIVNAYGGRPAHHKYIMSNQLAAYVDMCENGWETHIVFVLARSSLVLELLEFGIGQVGAFYCSRLEINLPITVDINWKHGNFASNYREIFHDLYNKSYDYFISQEDDMLIKSSHLSYYDKWNNFFSGSNYNPGFFLYEVSKFTGIYNNNSINFENSFDHGNISILTFTSYNRMSLKLIKVKGEMFIIKEKPATPFFIIHRDKLDQIIHTESWLGAQYYNKSLIGEYNVYFQHQWQYTSPWLENKHYLMEVISLSEFEQSLVHHQPNKYANFYHKNPQEEANLYITEEKYLNLLYSCLGIDIKKYLKSEKMKNYKNWTVNTTYVNLYKNSIRRFDNVCEICFSNSTTNAIFLNIVYELNDSMLNNTNAMVNYYCQQNYNHYNDSHYKIGIKPKYDPTFLIV